MFMIGGRVDVEEGSRIRLDKSSAHVTNHPLSSELVSV